MIAALLLGRKGSIGFPGKNLYPVLGHPLAFYPMRAALASESVDRTYISTDDEALMDLARANEVEVIVRPPELCTKEALGEDAYAHGYHEIEKRLGTDIELMVLLFCNAPTVTPQLIDEGIDFLRKNPDVDSAVSVSRYNMWSPLRARREDDSGLLQPFVPFETFGDPATLNCDRDSQGDVWFADMSVSIVRPRCLEHMDEGMLPQKWMGQKIHPLKQWGGCDVDYEWQIAGVEFWLKQHDLDNETAVRPRRHLADIYRVPVEEEDRLNFNRLDKNENLVGLPQSIIDEVIAKITPEFLSTYPPTYKIHRRISEKLGIDDDKVMVTAGTDAAIKMAFEAFVGPRDFVVFPNPTFAMVDVYSRLFQAQVKTVAYDDDLKLPLEPFLEAIDDSTKLIVIANPDSPTGHLLGEDQIRRIIERAASHRAVVLVDEAYYHFCPFTVLGLVEEYDNLIVTRSFSKALGLASVRLGLAAASPEIIGAMAAWRPMYEVNSFAVLFGLAVLDHPEWIDEVVTRTAAGLMLVEDAAKDLGLITYPINANFIHIEVGTDHVGPLVEAFRQAGILIRGNFSHPTLAKCIRISLGPADKMEPAVRVLRSYFK